MKKRSEEIKVTVGQVTKEFLVEACDVKPVRPNRYKFAVKIKEAGMYKNLGFIEAASFTIAAQQAFHKHF